MHSMLAKGYFHLKTSCNLYCQVKTDVNWHQALRRGYIELGTTGSIPMARTTYSRTGPKYFLTILFVTNLVLQLLIYIKKVKISNFLFWFRRNGAFYWNRNKIKSTILITCTYFKLNNFNIQIECELLLIKWTLSIPAVGIKSRILGCKAKALTAEHQRNHINLNKFTLCIFIQCWKQDLLRTLE